MESIAITGVAMLAFFAAFGQHLHTARSKGVSFVMTDRSTPIGSAGFAGRAERTLRNTVESAAMFVPAALLIVVLGAQSALSGLAATTYIAARSVFVLSYWTGFNKVRSASWAVGMASIGVTYFCVWGALAQ